MFLIEAIRDVAAKLRDLNDYVDRHQTAADLTELNQEYTPEAVRAKVQEAIDFVDKVIDRLAGDDDDREV